MLTDPALGKATVTGDLGAAFPPGHSGRVCVEGLSQAVYGCGDVAAGKHTYAISASWFSGSSVPVRVRALQFTTDANEAITGYSATGTRSGTLSSGG